MMKMKKYVILIILLWGQLSVYAQKIALDTIWIKDTYRHSQDVDDPSNHYYGGTELSLQFIHPKGDDSVAQRIREDITKRFFKTSEVLPLEESCQELLENSLHDGWFGMQATFLNQYSAVKIVNKKALNYMIYQECVLGCAHSTDSFDSYCYSLSTGNRITIDSLFSKSAQSKVIELLETREDDQGKRCGKHIEHLNHFIVLPKGLIFLYHKYQLGCGADGEYRYTVKYTEIKHLLKPQAVRYFHE